MLENENKDDLMGKEPENELVNTSDVTQEPENQLLDADDIIENNSQSDMQTEEYSDSPDGVKNTTITVNNEKYAVGLFWQPLQDPEDALNEIIETSETIVEGSDLYCIRTAGSMPQYALGTSSLNLRPGTKVAASAIADAFSDKPSSVAVFKVEEGWWFIALRSDLILAEDDTLYETEEEAKKAFMEMMAVPDWGRKIAPDDWKIPGATYIEVADILKNSSQLKLVKINKSQASKKIWIAIAVLLVVIIAIVKLVDILTPPPPPVYKPIPKVVKKVEPVVTAPVVKKLPELPPPWESMNNPTDILNRCNLYIKEQQAIAIPGWQNKIITCNVSKDNGNVVSNWRKADGWVAWFTNSLKMLEIENDYKLTINETGNDGTISYSFNKVEKMNSMPDLSRKDIRLQFIDIFDAITVPITFNIGTEGEIRDPNNPNAPPRPKYFLVKFKFTTEYAPDVWIDVLPEFQALTVDKITYNVEKKNWSYEGKVYERRN